MGYLKTSEFASLIGVSATTVRSWEQRGWLTPHHRSPSGYRYYTQDQVNKYLSGQLLVKDEKTEKDES